MSFGKFRPNASFATQARRPAFCSFRVPHLSVLSRVTFPFPCSVNEGWE